MTERAAHQEPLHTTQMRTEYARALCDTSQMARAYFPGWDAGLLVEVHTVAAWAVFAQIMERHRYTFDESAGGTYNCRRIAGSSQYSLHAYGLALDLNPSRNPHRTHTTDMPAPMVHDLEAVETVSGRLVFQWGNRWSGTTADPMHWQIGATKSELATGILDPGDDMPLNDQDIARIESAVRAVVRSELTDRTAGADGGANTGTGRAVLNGQALNGSRGSAAWTLKQIWEKTTGRSWSSLELDDDKLGPPS